jgi:hypothetical protein
MEKQNYEPGSIDELANEIFNRDTKKIEFELEISNENSKIYLFETLLDLLMKGIFIIYSKSFNLKQFDVSYILLLNKWFSKINYEIIINELEEWDSNLHYCRIVLKKNEEFFFLLHNMPEEYHFLVNMNFDESEFDNMYALVELNDKKYRISFTKKYM